MKIAINHVTRYSYMEPVMDSVNELRLTPRTNYRQSCYHHEVSTEPSASLFTYEDYFGNRVHSFSINKPHREMIVKTKAIVVTGDQSSIAKFGLPYEGQLELLQSEHLQNRYTEFLQPTAYTEINDDLLAYAARYPIDKDGFYAWAKSLMTGINHDFIYDPDATHVYTQIADTLRLRRGVCQDYTHLMIAICRSAGLPARYVSGYHFVGDLQGGSADFEQASHAWVEAHVPGTGWLGFDPTNNAEVDWRYVKLGHGRDYKDIVPVKGVYRGTAKQKLHVTVDVRLLEE